MRAPAILRLALYAHTHTKSKRKKEQPHESAGLAGPRRAGVVAYPHTDALRCHDLRRHQALALAADPQQWPAAALAKRFTADAEPLAVAIEYCSSYVVVHSSDGAAYAQRRPPPAPGTPAALAGSVAELGTANDAEGRLPARNRTPPQKPVTFKAEI